MASPEKIELRPPRHEMTLTGKFILEVPRIAFKHVLFYLPKDLGAIVLLNILHRHKVDYKIGLGFPQQLSNWIFTFSFTLGWLIAMVGNTLCWSPGLSFYWTLVLEPYSGIKIYFYIQQCLALGFFLKFLSSYFRPVPVKSIDSGSTAETPDLAEEGEMLTKPYKNHSFSCENGLPPVRIPSIIF